MMTLLETLNGIKGRPEWLGEWRPPTNDKETSFFINDLRRCDEFVAFAHPDRVDAYPAGKLSATELLDFALYIKRVEVVLERQNAPVMYMAGHEYSEVRDSIDDAIRRLRSGMKRQEPEIGYVTELDRIWNELCKMATTSSRAHQQIGILADMLDDGIGPKIDEKRAKYIAGEIRKNLELLP